MAINGKKGDWLELAGESVDISRTLEELHLQFKNAPVLGSLINPSKSLNQGSLFELKLDEIEGALHKALAVEKEHDALEVAVVAQGVAKAASILTNKYSLCVTNVPFLATRKQSTILLEFLEKYHYDERFDLAFSMMARQFDFLLEGGVSAIVSPQTWHYLGSYQKFREKLISQYRFISNVRLGTGAFETISGQVVNASLTIIQNKKPEPRLNYFSIDVSKAADANSKGIELAKSKINRIQQDSLLALLDKPILMAESGDRDSLLDFSSALAGVATGDSLRFYRSYWEVQNLHPDYELLHGSIEKTSHYKGLSQAVLWENETGSLYNFVKSMKHLNSAAQRWKTGQEGWGRVGVSASRMGNIVRTIYTGAIFDQNVAVICPKDENDLAAVWAYCESDQYFSDLREANPNLAISSSTVAKVPFDKEYWSKVADEKYPNGLPKPYTNDPTQWIFHGHPCGSVIWDEEQKWTAHGSLRTDNSVLHIAVARLLGYRWPAELDVTMELADEQREWVKRSEALLSLVDDDGIVCIPAVRGEALASDRLINLLAAAYGDAWRPSTLNQLLTAVGYAGKTLDDWLRDKFFEQHVKLFQNRPFIWQLWDGLNDGFSVLVNYHKFDQKLLETLIYTYLGDWIKRQKDEINAGVDGAQERLAAAENLRKRLIKILEGEAPLDIFVRWKPLQQQPIGWNPDLNDGVRLNIRPFILVDDVKVKDAGVLRNKISGINWNKDRGADVPSAPWYHLGLQYGGKEGDRINEHHLSLAQKKSAMDAYK
jgi:hypothetical protein